MAKKADTWMPFYIADYLRATMPLTTQQHGAYLLLIMACWEAGGRLPKSPAALAGIAKLSIGPWLRMAPTIMAYFDEDGDGYTQKRVLAEHEKAQRLSAARQESGKKGGRPRKQPQSQPKPIGSAEDNQNETPSQVLDKAPYRALSQNPRRSPTSEPEGSSPPAWQGPQDIRELCVSKHGEDFTRSWLDVCGWQDVPEPMILAPGQLYADRLWRALRRELSDRGVSIGRKAA